MYLKRDYPSYSSIPSLARYRGSVERLSPISFVFATIMLLFAVPAWGVQDSVQKFPMPMVSSAADLEEAQVLLKNKKWAEAAVVFRSVVRKLPDYSPAAMGLARALVFSNRREEALAVLWRAADREKAPNRSVLIRRGRVISRQFLSSGSFQVYQDGLSFLQARKYRQARERFEKALAQEPDNVEVLVRLGQCLALDQDYDSATEYLRFAKRLNPHEPEIRLWLGRTMHQRGEIKEAIEELRLAKAQLQNSELAPVWLSAALFSYGQKVQATQVLEEDIKAQPYHLASLLHLAWTRTQAVSRDNQALWAARKDMQLILSRLDQYEMPSKNRRCQIPRLGCFL